jgi:hypothetical protein
MGIYENGWNGREVVAHLAGIEWSLPGLITRTPGPRDVIREGAGDDGQLQRP